MRDRTPIPAADDACPLCGWWTCRCTKAPGVALRAVPTGSDSDPDMDEALRRVRAGGRR